MPNNITFNVESYEIIIRTLETTAGSAKYENLLSLALYSPASDPISRRLIIQFVPPDALITAPSTQVDAGGEIIDGGFDLSTNFLPVVMDLLKNDTQLTAGLFSDDPTSNFVSLGPRSISSPP